MGVPIELFPSVLAILTCDSIIIDELTKKKTIVGIFDAMWFQKFPRAQRFGFYARMVDLDGEYKFTIRIVALSETEELIGVMDTATMACSDRLGIIELVLNLPPVPFPRAGRYELQLYANEDYIGRAVIEANAKPESGPQPQR